MGSEGGIRISEISKIKEKWPAIKKEIIEMLQERGNASWGWNNDDYIKKIPEISNLENDISGYSNIDVLDFLRSFIRQCDTPFTLGDHIIFSCGSNMDEVNNYIANCFPGEYIETWT